MSVKRKKKQLNECMCGHRSYIYQHLLCQIIQSYLWEFLSSKIYTTIQTILILQHFSVDNMKTNGSENRALQHNGNIVGTCICIPSLHTLSLLNMFNMFKYAPHSYCHWYNISPNLRDVSIFDLLLFIHKRYPC